MHHLHDDVSWQVSTDSAIKAKTFHDISCHYCSSLHCSGTPNDLLGHHLYVTRTASWTNSPEEANSHGMDGYARRWVLFHQTTVQKLATGTPATTPRVANWERGHGTTLSTQRGLQSHLRWKVWWSQTGSDDAGKVCRFQAKHFGGRWNSTHPTTMPRGTTVLQTAQETVSSVGKVSHWECFRKSHHGWLSTGSHRTRTMNNMEWGWIFEQFATLLCNQDTVWVSQKDCFNKSICQYK